MPRALALSAFPLPALALSALLTAHGVAGAQTPMPGEAVRFALKPRSGLQVLRSAPNMAAGARARIDRLDRIAADDRGHEMDILVRRHNRRLVQERGGTPFPSHFGPRSRMILLTAEDRVPLGDRLTAMAGFQGVKLSNSNANVTASGSGDGIGTRDWLMPRVAMEIAPAPDIGLTIGYSEALRGYGETGLTGPMGLTRDAFRTLARTLRAETHSRLRIDAGWNPSPGLTLAIAAYRGRINDRLSFVDGGYLPRNDGSTRIQGASIGFSHRLSSHWRWSMRYGEAHLNRAKEHSLAVEAGWTKGPWSGMLRGTRSSTPAFPTDGKGQRRPVRVEAEMRYQLPGPLRGMVRGPASVSLRLTDPDRLASTVFLRDDISGVVHAADQARGLMLGMALNW